MTYRRAAMHDARRARVAADWAITKARRRNEFVVLVVDVQREAAEQFALELTRTTAAAMLRERLELRGPMLTDAGSE